MRTVHSIRLILLGLLGLCGCAFATAQVPNLINYQGRIVVDGVNFSGNGQFKFALVNADGSSTYWSHDASSSAGSEPSSHIVLPVSSGLYAVQLGDTKVKSSAGSSMQSIEASNLDHSEVYLRIWFKAGTTGFQRLAPDQRIAAVAYAIMAGSVPDGSITTAKLAPGSVTADKLASSVNGSVADGSITTAKLADGAVTAAKLAVSTGDLIPAGSITNSMLAPGSVTVDKLSTSASGGNLLASMSENDQDLLDGGFVRFRSIPAKVWEASTVTGGPNARSLHSGFWTGLDMIVWGGKVGSSLSQQGGAYNPQSQTWTLLPTSAASPGRSHHTTVWTGDRMIVWGGFLESGATQTGALYVPDVPNSSPPIGGWLATTVTAAPAARTGHSAVWTGSEMLIWGGNGSGGALSSGGAYTPPTGALVPGVEGSWTSLATSGAPAARRGHTAVWTGSKMVVWGGLDTNFQTLGSGAIYDPANNTWTALPSSGAPSARTGHTAIWTGSKMLIFGGANAETPGSASNLLSDGAAYDPAAGTWSAISAIGAPSARFAHGAVWTGSEMMILGGETLGGQVENTAAAYNVASDTWRSLATSSTSSSGQSQVWSGSEILVFGDNGLQTLDSAPAVYFYVRF